jgi:hypothetical protein
MRERFDVRAFVAAWLSLFWVAAIAILIVNHPLPTLSTMLVVGGFGVWVFWYWMHTWTEHAWEPERFAFWRMLWRRLTGRE